MSKEATKQQEKQSTYGWLMDVYAHLCLEIINNKYPPNGPGELGKLMAQCVTQLMMVHPEICSSKFVQLKEFDKAIGDVRSDISREIKQALDSAQLLPETKANVIKMMDSVLDAAEKRIREEPSLGTLRELHSRIQLRTSAKSQI